MKKGLLALLVGKPAKPSKEEDAGMPAADSSDDMSGDYGKELSDILGVKEEDREAFLDALKGVIRSCEHEDEDEEE